MQRALELMSKNTVVFKHKRKITWEIGRVLNTLISKQDSPKKKSS
jgi:hypothetical protein